MASTILLRNSSSSTSKRLSPVLFSSQFHTSLTRPPISQSPLTDDATPSSAIPWWRSMATFNRT